MNFSAELTIFTINLLILNYRNETHTGKEKFHFKRNEKISISLVNCKLLFSKDQLKEE